MNKRNSSIFMLTTQTDSLCKTIFNQLNKDKARVGGLLHLHRFASLLPTPSPMSFISSQAIKSNDKMQRITTYVKWRPVKNFDGYFITNTGVVRKESDGTMGIVRQHYNDRGYAYVVMRYKGRHHRARMIHQLVFDSFTTEPKRKGYDIHHKDQNFLNNNFDNLVYITKQQHYLIHGKILKQAS